MKRIVHTLLFFSAVITAPVTAQINAPLAPATNDVSASENSSFSLEGKENWVELPEYRQQHRLGYKTPDGRIIFHFSKANLCFTDMEGNLKPVNCDLKKGPFGWWSAGEQQFPATLENDGSTRMLIGKDMVVSFNRNCKLNNDALFPDTITALKNTGSITYHTLPITKDISFRENCIETDYVISDLLPNQTGSLNFSEEIEIPSNLILKRDEARGKKLMDGSWQGDLVVLSPEGNEAARFRMPVYYDANNAVINGSYKLTGSNGKYKLEMIVPSAWIHDPARVFPITIDPLVTGPNSSWPGGTMPSCLLPNYNKDSILVNVPGQITVSALMVQSSYYADPISNTPKSDGSMFFSTSCNSSPLLTVTGPQGQLPGTAYLQYTNYHSPLMCCFPTQCAGFSFYLTMNLGRLNQGVGCNTTYILYDPVTAWPFSAYVEGHTVESYGQNWMVGPSAVCSDVCTLTATVYTRYGVPPYTITHPWMTGSVTAGTILACGTANSVTNLTLTRPNCPTYCGNSSTLTVPPPVIIDACGNAVPGLTSKTVTVNPTPTLVPNPVQQSVCSGNLYNINFTSCVPNSTVSYTSNSQPSGNGNVNSSSINNTQIPDTVFYYATPTSPLGCVGPVDTAAVEIDPYPIANAGTDTLIETGETVVLNGSGGTTYSWAPATWLSCTNCQNPNATPLATTAYVVFVTQNGCTSSDTVVVDVEFPPMNIFVPNAFTFDGNGVNDVLQPSLLGIAEFEFRIFDRWGEEICKWDGLTGSWDGTYKGARVQQGVYVYWYHAIPSDLRYAPQEKTGTITVFSNAKKQ